MTKLFKIYSWIDQEMKFDHWYKVESEEQKLLIHQVMDSGLIPDCEFNIDSTKFRKLKLAIETFYKKDDYEKRIINSK